MPVTEYHQSKMALGSDTTLVVVTDASETAVQGVFAELWLTIFQFEQRFSRFLPNSELTRLNQSAGVLCPVSDDMYAMLQTVQRLSADTDGLFNPFVLPALQRAGYHASAVQAYTNDTAPDFRDRSVASPDALVLEKGKAIIPYGTAIDLGGCGKGYLADLLAELPIAHDLAGFWFSLGGDIRGRGTNAQGEGWKVAVQDAHRPDTSLAQTISGNVSGFAVATSGTIVHRNTPGQAEWHHIIDPRTGKSAESDVLLATVGHERAVDADVLASCAVILGMRDASDFLRKRGAYDILLQSARKASPIFHQHHTRRVAA